MSHFQHSLNDDSDYKREEIIRKIEHAIEQYSVNSYVID